MPAVPSYQRKAGVITGASQGIGEALITAYRKLGYAVVANSRTIEASDDPMVLAVAGDIGQAGVGRMPASSSPSHSPITPTTTMTPSPG